MHTNFRQGSAVPGDRTGLVLINLGTPQAPTAAAVRRYLGEFLHDHRVVDLSRWLWCPLLHGVILPLRAPKVARAYASIWTDQGSPLMVFSQRLGDGLAAALPGIEVRVAMRYGMPSVASVLREIDAAGCSRIVVLPLYPQYSASTQGSAHDAVMKELLRWRRQPELRLIQHYHQDPLWVAAVAASISEYWAQHGRGERLLFSFHGLPERFIAAGDPYAAQARASAEAIAAVLGLNSTEWTLGFQSRFGREPWLKPYTDQLLAAWAAEKAGRVDVVCPGFAVDCLETLEEIAERSAHAYIAAGGAELRYIPALNAASSHVAAMKALFLRHAHGWV